MSKCQTLRALVNERLAAAADEIFALFEKTIAEYEEELCRSKEANQRKQQLVTRAPRAGVHSPSVSPSPGLNQETLQIKLEEEELPESRVIFVKIEESSLLQQRDTELREDIAVQPHFHSEIEGHKEHFSDTHNDEYWGAPFSFSAAQMETEAEEDQYHVYRNTDVQDSSFSSEYRSTPERSTTVNNGDVSGTAARPERRNKHQCFVCEKTFRRKQILQQHIRVHTGEKPFSCSTCKRTFRQRGNLYQHVRIHTGEKPFSCSICLKTFRQKSNLDQHVKIHTGEKPFSCLICKKTFNRKSTLDKHTNTHK